MSINYIVVDILFLALGLLSCQNETKKQFLVKEIQQNLDTCIVTKIEENEGSDFIHLIQKSRYSYLLLSAKSVSITRYKDTCKSGYQVVITIADLSYEDKDFSKKLFDRFEADNIRNFKLKAWNYVLMKNQGERNLFICVEDIRYMDKWQMIIAEVD